MRQRPLCSHPFKPAVWIAIVVAAVIAPSVARSAPQPHGDLRVEVVGEGRPVLMIPGLNSSAEVWRQTCQALQPLQCHLIQLPGFAGAPPAVSEPFLDGMRDQVLAYAASQKLQQPAVIGHSLGGLLGMKLALAAPEAIGPLVIVDSLPFFAAATNPAASVASVQPMAAGMRRAMMAADDATYTRQAEAALAGMTRSPERVEELKRWGAASDRATTSQAMYELLVTDLRDDLAGVRTPTLVLGAWAAYANFGQTREATRAIFAGQYAKLPGVRIALSDTGYHFLMWDDPQWLQGEVRGFLAAHPASGG
ncbi:alpha/beta hydrolase [Xanthomonas sp. XNM01]|uniref:alpha/beta fold hydrolase n=1 Tax=Xanthomonas sp. XNM01 TaxID=2769289 RepID=UPI00177FAC3F|nr:alpha/beta hydrolase [Xanthomonas sp. XNM01]MBD9367193.1 alpha/beta hydrolase [Xanthomonas sp. XNM01]